MKSIKPTFCNSIVLFVFEMIPAKFGKNIQHTLKGRSASDEGRGEGRFNRCVGGV